MKYRISLFIALTAVFAFVVAQAYAADLAGKKYW
jgi:hypothetical protein